MKYLSRPDALLALVLAGISSACFVSALGEIDINSAPLKDLVKIIHIGEARAIELISLRPFSSLDDLARINGLGASRVADIKSQGLAWVDESHEVEPQTTEALSPPKKELAAVGEQISQKTSFPLLIALALAVFSGIIILALKKKIKIG